VRIVVAVCLVAALPAAAGITVAAPPGNARTTPACRCEQRGTWFVAETANFSVWTTASFDSAIELGGRCEGLRRHLITEWIADADDDWGARCFVVVHPDIEAYRRQSGNAVDVSVGWTTITTDRGEVIYRRIDLRCDAADWRTNALPHELTHVVLAEEFADQKLPAWLNEGIAMTSETDALQRQRLAVLHAAHGSGRAPPLADVVRHNRLHHPEDRDTLYAASYSLVRHLLAEGDSRQILEFARHARRDGYDAALHRTYAIAGGLPELQRRWLGSLRNASSAATDERSGIGDE
jgi:hypothetical protein